VREHRGESADALADAVFQAARTCCGPPKDDMSLLVIKATEPRTTVPSAEPGLSPRSGT
jgi:hypothetical protein